MKRNPRQHAGKSAAISATVLALATFFSFATLLASCQLTTVPMTPGNRYALIIGMSDYPGNGSDLDYPAKDARDMTTLLTAQGWTVKYTLVDGNATYATIQTDIQALSTDPEATILVYYSGHGSSDNGTAYIIPYDGLYLNGNSVVYEGTTYYETGDDLTKWITPATLTSWMASVPAKHRLLILDSCYSGAFVTSDVAVDTSPADYSQQNNTTSETGLIAAALSKFNSMVAANITNYGNSEIQVLSAAGSDEYSWDGTEAMANGAFTYYLLEAGKISPSTSLAKGDADGDGVVTVDEAYAYSKTQIKAIWNLKNWSWGGGTGDFLPHISGGTGDVVLYTGN